jgi:uncharacterized protein YjbI with pentapeptide repeats
VEKITVRQTSADLPVFDEHEDLELVPSPGTESGLVSDFQFGPATLRTIDWTNVRLLHGKVRRLRAERADITGARIDSVDFADCELSSVSWSGGKLSRVRFDTCKLLGGRFEAVTLDNVVFTGCKLDYAAFSQLRATGPVLFVRCSLREAEFTGCRLAHCLFDGCDVQLTDFGPGNYRACDLRGNDLSALNSTRHLKHVIVDRAQLLQLAEALAAELDLTFGDDLPDHPDPRAQL